MHQPNGPARFPVPMSVGPRQWGKEEHIFTEPEHFTFKRITMHAGAKGGLQYHHKKSEGGIVTHGQILIRYDDGVDGTLSARVCGPGDCFYFPQGAVHQAEAITDCEYIEVSTPFWNDRVHCEKEYGIEEEAGGLPSTAIDDVIPV